MHAIWSHAHTYTYSLISSEITGVLGDITVYQPSWHATLTAPDESRGRDETGRASPVVAFLPFTPYIRGSIPHGDTTLDKRFQSDCNLKLVTISNRQQGVKV